MNEELTDDERSALQRMFWKNNEEIQRKLKEELTILSKYKGDLAKNYEQVGSYQNTLVGCMKDIIGKQDELIGLCSHLGDMANRIERFFLNDTPPRHQEPNFSKYLISEYLDLPVRAINILKNDKIVYMKDLLKLNPIDLLKIPNLGKKSLSKIMQELKNKGLTLGACDE